MWNAINRLRPHLRRALNNPNGAINYMYRTARDPIINHINGPNFILFNQALVVAGLFYLVIM